MNHEQTTSEKGNRYTRELKQKINILLELERIYTEEAETLQNENTELRAKLDSMSHISKELIQENLILQEIQDLYTDSSEELEATTQNLSTVISEKKKVTSELEQNEIIMTDLNKAMVNKISELEESNKDLKEKLHQKSLSSKETAQEKIFLREVSKNEISKTQAISKKYYLTIAIAGIVLAGVIVPYSLYVVTLVGEEYRIEVEPQSTGYTIQNLRGDIIDTYLSWRIVEGSALVVNILNADKFEPEVLETIKKTILSEEILEIDNSLLHTGPKGTTSLMYVGWQGAMAEAAKTETLLYVPAKFEVISSKSGEGDITIELTNTRNADGFSGWTNSIADASQNQILKSRVTIFAVDSISLSALETVVRHELGHALGLAHSSAPEDLMYPIIETNFPYISDCDIDAITLLYDGGESSQVVCES